MSRRGLVTGLAVAVLAGALLTAAWMRQAGPGASPTVTDALPGGEVGQPRRRVHVGGEVTRDRDRLPGGDPHPATISTRWNSFSSV